MRAHALLLLVAGTGLARGGGSSDGGSTPSDAAVYDAAWTFVLSAAAHAADTESDPDKFCRTAMVTLARWLPGEADRERMLAIFKSSVVHERLKFMPTMDDCSILLWYAHEAGALARGGKVSPSGLAPDATFAADAGAQAAAAALWVSPVRERVLAVIDRVWLGHAAEHPAVVSARPQLDLFVMSACPYGILAENELLGSALPMLGDTFDLQVAYAYSPLLPFPHFGVVCRPLRLRRSSPPIIYPIPMPAPLSALCLSARSILVECLLFTV